MRALEEIARSLEKLLPLLERACTPQMIIGPKLLPTPDFPPDWHH